MSNKSTAIQVLYSFLRTDVGDPHAMDQLALNIRSLKPFDDPNARTIYETFLNYLQQPFEEQRLRYELRKILNQLLDDEYENIKRNSAI